MVSRRIFTVVSIVITLSLILTAFAPGVLAQEGEDEKLTVALSVPDMAFPFFVFMADQVKDEAEKIGNVDIVLLDATNSSPKQTADLEAVIAKGYDGVLISPIDVEALVPGVQALVDAGIPVVTIDRTVYGVDTLAHVGADNVRGGELQGELGQKLLSDGGKAFNLLGQPGTSPAIDRGTGLHNILDAQEEIELVAEQTANFRRDEGLSVTEAMLAAEPEPAVIFAANDEMAFGAVEALASRGIEKGDVAIIGYDAHPEALGFVQDGAMAGTVEQFPGKQSRKALRALVDYVRTGVEPAEHDIWIAPKMLTADNLNEAERADQIGLEPAPPKEALTVALSVPDMAFPFFVFMADQVADEAEKIGDIDIVLLDATNSSPKQTADLEAVIAKAYDGVLISPIDVEALVPGVQALIDAGIPVVTIDRTVYGVNTLAHVGADNVRGGELQGEYGQELLPDGGKAFNLLGQPGTSPAIDRGTGLHNILDAQEEIELVAEQTANFRRDEGLSVTEAMLAAEPEPAVIFAANDEMAFGAVEALASRGIEKGDVAIIGYDAHPEALGFVQDGAMAGTVEQFPGMQSRRALQVLVSFVREGVGRGPGQHDVWIVPVMITADNLDQAERVDQIQ